MNDAPLFDPPRFDPKSAEADLRRIWKMANVIESRQMDFGDAPEGKRDTETFLAVKDLKAITLKLSRALFPTISLWPLPDSDPLFARKDGDPI